MISRGDRPRSGAPAGGPEWLCWADRDAASVIRLIGTRPAYLATYAGRRVLPAAMSDHSDQAGNRARQHQARAEADGVVPEYRARRQPTDCPRGAQSGGVGRPSGSGTVPRTSGGRLDAGRRCSTSPTCGWRWTCKRCQQSLPFNRTPDAAAHGGVVRLRTRRVWPPIPSSSMRRTLRFTAASGPPQRTRFSMRMWPVNEAHITIALAHDQVTRHDPQRAHAVHAAIIDAIQTRGHETEDSGRIRGAYRRQCPGTGGDNDRRRRRRLVVTE